MCFRIHGFRVLTYGVHAHQPEELDFGHCFIVGPRVDPVDALVAVVGHADLGGRPLAHLDQPPIVGAVHREESLARVGVVGSPKRMLPPKSEKVQMVLDEHDVAHLKGVVDAPGRVGDYQPLDPQQLQDANGGGHLLQRVTWRAGKVGGGLVGAVGTFVVVEAAFHAHHGHVGEGAEDQFPSVTRHGALGEMGDGFVAESEGVFDGVGQASFSTKG